MEENLKEIELQLNDSNEARELFGNNDNYLRRIEQQLDVFIITRGEKIQVFRKAYRFSRRSFATFIKRY